jgi:hypothetical protein
MKEPFSDKPFKKLAKLIGNRQAKRWMQVLARRRADPNAAAHLPGQRPKRLKLRNESSRSSRQ